ncbi:MAG: glycosyltransferase [Solirubrobacterales bacterium]
MKVSAVILTYNHERFIAEAIEGFLMQRVNFPCELVIIDDCSTDGTRQIVRRYWEKASGRIRVLLNRHNIGARASIVRAYAACRGDYVAFLDGDDYWVCPDKLQRQADLLDSRPDYAMCFHSVTVVWDDGRQKPAVMRPPKIKEVYALADLLECNVIQACSPMYRKGLFREHPAWVYLTPVMDWAHHVLHAQYGDIGYIDEPMGVYRQHAGGVYSAKDEATKLRIAVDTLRRLRCVVPREHRARVRHSLGLSYCRLAREYCDRGRYDEARQCVKECVGEISVGRSLPVRDLLATTLRAYVPGVHRRCKQALHRMDRHGIRLARIDAAYCGRSDGPRNETEEVGS